jgi:Leucine zipper with capping helix domain/Mnd1 HTH domain
VPHSLICFAVARNFFHAAVRCDARTLFALRLGSVVDINQALVDDGLVDKDKIGGCNYFWSFPAKKDRLLQVQHEAVLQAIEELGAQVKDATSRLQDAKRGREEDGEGESRASKLRRLEEGAAELAKLAAEHEAQKENDPQVVADLEKELKLVTEAAHRWTDNIFNCKSYLTKKRGMDRKEAEKILGITSDFDCASGSLCGAAVWATLKSAVPSSHPLCFRLLVLFRSGRQKWQVAREGRAA